MTPPPGRLRSLLAACLRRAYPRGFRRRYDADMRDAFLDAWRAEAAGRGARAELRFWLRAAWSSLRGGLTARSDAWRSRERTGGSGVRESLRMQSVLAWRRTRRSPVLLFVSVASLGLGIGGTAGLATVADAAFRQSLPYPDAGELYRVSGQTVASGAPRVSSLSLPDLTDLEARATLLAGVAAFSAPRSVNLVTELGASTLSVELVSEQYFDVLGVQPVMGRAFDADEAAGTAAAPVVVLSHDFWRDRLGRSREAVGALVRLNDLPHTVIGVMPEGFRGETGGAAAWLPVVRAGDLYSSGYVDNRRLRWLSGLARAHASARPADVSAEVARIGRDLAAEHPEDNGNHRLRASSLRDAWYGSLRLPLTALITASLLALMVVCLNLSGIQISAALSRRRDTAVCRALGATRAPLLTSVVVESALLSVSGFVAGLLIAGAVLELVGGSAAPVLRAELELGALGVAVAVALAVVTGVAMVVAAAAASPGVVAASVLSAPSLRQGRSERSADRLRRALVVGQMAVAAGLCAGAVQLAASVRALNAIDLGFEPEGLVAFRADLLGPAWDDDDRTRTLATELVAGLRGAPGVASAAVAGPGGVPAGDLFGFYFAVERDDEPGWETDRLLLPYHAVTPDYFTTLGLELTEGRGFTAADDTVSPGVTVVTRSLVRRFWPSGPALGRELRVGVGPDADVFRVVGVVEDPAYEGRTRTPELAGAEHVFLSLAQRPPSLPPRVQLLVRVQPGALDAVAAHARNTMAAAAPDLPLHDAQRIETLLERQTARERLHVTVAVYLAGLAALLASLGVHGVVSADVRRRRHEVGVRLAVGASPRTVGLEVVRDSVRLTAIGLAIGLAIGVGIGHLIEDLLFGVDAVYPAGLAAVTCLLLVSACTAAVLPAREAVRTDAARILVET